MSAPLRVLIADDDRDALLTLGILLRSEGYDVRLAQTARTHMPGYSGLRVAQELQRHYSRDRPLLVAVPARCWRC